MRTVRAARASLAALLVAAALTAAGCTNTNDPSSDLPRPSKAFCEAAARYDQRITSKETPIAMHISMVEKIVETAPRDVKHDAEVFLDALKRRARGDMSVVDNPKVKRASDDVLRRAGQDCGWYRRQSGM